MRQSESMGSGADGRRAAVGDVNDLAPTDALAEPPFPSIPRPYCSTQPLRLCVCFVVVMAEISTAERERERADDDRVEHGGRRSMHFSKASALALGSNPPTDPPFPFSNNA